MKLNKMMIIGSKNERQTRSENEHIYPKLTSIELNVQNCRSPNCSTIKSNGETNEN